MPRRTSEPNISPEDAPELQPGERRAAESKATDAGKAARRQKAVELMPFEKLPDNQRIVAAWLLTNKGLEAFHTNYIDSSERPYTLSTIFVFRRLPSSTAGSVSPHKVQDFEDFVAALAHAFCGYTDSHEIHALMGMVWGISVSVDVRDNNKVPTQVEYRYKPTRWQNALRSLPRGYAEPTREDLALTVILKLGQHNNDLRAAYDEAYLKAYEEEEKKIRSDARRNKKLLQAAERAARRSEKG
jgi:hypothetical protein